MKLIHISSFLTILAISPIRSVAQFTVAFVYDLYTIVGTIQALYPSPYKEMVQRDTQIAAANC